MGKRHWTFSVRCSMFPRGAWREIGCLYSPADHSPAISGETLTHSNFGFLSDFGFRPSDFSPPLPPLVLGILPLQLRFKPRIMLAPEIRQILRHLHRLHSRREDVHQHRHT